MSNGEQEHWLNILFKNFERIIRWIYPGIFFFVLWHDVVEDKFGDLVPLGDSLWPLFLAVIGIGSAIYLFQHSFIFQILIFIAQKVNWDVAKDSEDFDPKGTRPKPQGKLKNLADFFDKQAAEIERKMGLNKYSGIKNLAVMDYQWGVYHATSITGFLLLIYVIGAFNGWILTAAILMILFSLYLFARNCRVRR